MRMPSERRRAAVWSHARSAPHGLGFAALGLRPAGIDLAARRVAIRDARRRAVSPRTHGGTPPPSLDALVPRYLAAVPLDPFSGESARLPPIGHRLPPLQRRHGHEGRRWGGVRDGQPRPSGSRSRERRAISASGCTSRDRLDGSVCLLLQQTRLRRIHRHLGGRHDPADPPHAQLLRDIPHGSAARRKTEAGRRNRQVFLLPSSFRLLLSSVFLLAVLPRSRPAVRVAVAGRREPAGAVQPDAGKVRILLLPAPT